MYNLMGYNKDRDTYEELFIFHKLSVAELMFERLIELLKNDILKDETGETSIGSKSGIVKMTTGWKILSFLLMVYGTRKICK